MFGHFATLCMKGLTWNLGIIFNIKFQEVVSKCPKYRESVNISWLEAKTQIVISLNEYLKQLSSN